ncbi:MAG: winged helix DNA-binding protein [Thermaerobacter sp.]|nr:winged helix DNA-binding protein [Thermaerobacter sp.]
MASTATPSQEDYLEAIWHITEQKGYARVSDIAEYLAISQASVSKMIRRLKEAGVLEVQRYRGLSLTPHGARLGCELWARHRTLERFLKHLGVTDPAQLHQHVEGIEHYFSPDTLALLTSLVVFIDQHPEWWADFHRTGDGP